MICDIDMPDCANCMMASAAPMASTLSLGSMPRLVIRSPSGCASSKVTPMTLAMSAMPCSRSIALPTPMPTAVVMLPMAATAPTPTAMATLPATPAMVLSLPPMPSITSEDLSIALMMMSSCAIYVPHCLRRVALRRSSTSDSTAMHVSISCTSRQCMVRN